MIFLRLFAPSDAVLARVQALYEANFPPVMRKPFSVIAQGSHDGSVLLLVARDEALTGSEAIIGIATLATLPNSPSLYLGYLATDPARHNQGIGSQLFRFMVEYAAVHTAAESIVWEVEGPEPDEHHIHNRRIRFYERLGARVVTMANTYRMPDDHGGMIPLRLMWVPVRAEGIRLPDPALVAAWIRDIYDLVYAGCEDLAAQLIDELDEVS
jgi:GNAT superfamily N-acetyltransferase